MKRTFIVAVIVFITLLTSVDQGDAGMVIVSGDTNIINSLTGDMTGINSGNQQFFTNILEGGSKVVVQNGGNGNFGVDLQSFYAKIGVSDLNISGAVTAASLSGASTFISIEPVNTFSISDISVLKTFLANGGNVFLLGDYVYSLQGVTTGFLTQDNNINTDLINLGSSIQIVPNDIDELYHTIGPANITSNLLTAGVNTFSYAFTSQVTGGTTLFTTQTGHTAFIAAETIGISAVPEPPSLLMTGMSACFVVLLAWKKSVFEYIL